MDRAASPASREVRRGRLAAGTALLTACAAGCSGGATTRPAPGHSPVALLDRMLRSMRELGGASPPRLDGPGIDDACP